MTADDARYLGFVLLATDHGTEDELHRYVPAPYRAITSRTALYSAASAGEALDGTTDAARRLLPGSALAAVGYACTSGSLVLGDAAVAAAVAAGRDDVPVRTTAGAVASALRALEARRVAVLSPYDAPLGERLDREVGLVGEVVASAHHDLATDEEIAAASAEEITDRAVALLDGVDVDALVVACNAWRAVGAVEAVEDRTGVPVVTSTQALLWSMLSADSAPVPSTLGALAGRAPLA